MFLVVCGSNTGTDTIRVGGGSLFSPQYPLGNRYWYRLLENWWWADLKSVPIFSEMSVSLGITQWTTLTITLDYRLDCHYDGQSWYWIVGAETWAWTNGLDSQLQYSWRQLHNLNKFCVLSRLPYQCKNTMNLNIFWRTTTSSLNTFLSEQWKRCQMTFTQCLVNIHSDTLNSQPHRASWSAIKRSVILINACSY